MITTYCLRTMRLRIIAIAGVLLVTIGCASTTPQTVNVNILAINDLHGYLNRAENAVVRVNDPDSSSGISRLQVGGISNIASLIQAKRTEHENVMFVGVGDLIGGSPAISSFTQDEATINILNQLGMEVSVVGNHEFDKGQDELKRIQRGGCAPGKKIGVETCVKDDKFDGATFRYLAANVLDPQTQQTFFPATHIKTFGNTRVGFVGVTLRDTPKATRGANNLSFMDEVGTINTHAEQLKQQGVDAVVALIHQGGGTTSKTINDKSCPDVSGPIVQIVQGLKHVDVVLSGHTHREYVCVDQQTGIVFTQAEFYGNVVTHISLDIIPGKGVVKKIADNIPVITDQNQYVPKGYVAHKKDTVIDQEVRRYDELSQAKRRQVQGYIATPMPFITIPGTNARNDMVEQPMGKVIADAFLQIVPGSIKADIALVNPGGVRSGLQRSGPITYEELFFVAPFGNNLFYTDLTGEQLIRLLEQQWEQPNCKAKPLIIQNVNLCGRLLQPSSTLTYIWDVTRGPGKASGKGDLVVLDSVRIGQNQEPIDLKKMYRVVANSFLAEEGGDNFTVFKQGVNLQDLGIVDIEAIVGYFNQFSREKPLAAPQKRVTCQGCPSME